MGKKKKLNQADYYQKRKEQYADRAFRLSIDFAEEMTQHIIDNADRDRELDQKKVDALQKELEAL